MLSRLIRPLVLASLACVTLAIGAVLFRDRLTPVYARLVHLPWIGHSFEKPAKGPTWVCPMHPEVTSHEPGTCPKCGMDLVLDSGAAETTTPSDARPAETPAGTPAGPPRAGLTIDLRRQQLLGVRTAAAVLEPISHTIRTVGAVRSDETRQADVNLKVEAYVKDLFVDFTGQYVRAGQPLFTVYSPDLLATQNEYLLALRTRDQFASSQVADTHATAERLVASARQRLLLWDLTSADLESIERTRQALATVEFRSPVSGHVLEKSVVKGQRVMPGETLYRLADLSVVWVEADVFEREMAWVRVGQVATVQLDAWPGETFTGRVTYINPIVDPPTRSVKVRLELPNRSGRLKPGMFANVELSSSLGRGVVVPTDAVVDNGRTAFVFMALGDGYFEPREVRLGLRLDGKIQVLSGLKAGEVIASAATFFIDSESQLRAAMQGFMAPPTSLPGAGDASVRASTSALALALRTEPDPPRHGDNVFVVEARDAEGRAVADADVVVTFYMPPMPSMNMPAMSAEARLLPEAEGVYRGHGRISMAGRWDATVVVSRGGQRLGSRQFALVVR
jgi:RND family efflux transporter MFP subunit